MAERINKHYKPAELEAAICILLLTAPVGITEQNARDKRFAQMINRRSLIASFCNPPVGLEKK